MANLPQDPLILADVHNMLDQVNIRLDSQAAPVELDQGCSQPLTGREKKFENTG